MLPRLCIAVLVCSALLCGAALAAEPAAAPAAEPAAAEEQQQPAADDSVASLLAQISTRVLKRAIKKRQEAVVAAAASGKKDRRHHSKAEQLNAAQDKEPASSATIASQHEEYAAYPGHTDSICLQEVKTDAAMYPSPMMAGQDFKSVFACCEEPSRYVGGCSFSTRSSGAAAAAAGAGGSNELREQVGDFTAHCMFKWPGKCVPPHMLNQMFTTSLAHGDRYWLQMEAALASPEASALSVFSSSPIASVASIAAGAGAADVATAAAAAAAAEPSLDDPNAVRGMASQFSARLASIPGLLAGGSVDYTAGFVQEGGHALCPENLAEPDGWGEPMLGAPYAPLVKCGLMRLTLHYEQPEQPYYNPYGPEGDEYWSPKAAKHHAHHGGGHGPHKKAHYKPEGEPEEGYENYQGPQHGHYYRKDHQEPEYYYQQPYSSMTHHAAAAAEQA